MRPNFAKKKYFFGDLQHLNVTDNIVRCIQMLQKVQLRPKTSTSTQNFNFHAKLKLRPKTSTSTQNLNFDPKLKLGPKMKTLDAASVKTIQYFCLGITALDRPCIGRSDAVICERKDSIVLTDDASKFWPISQVLVLGRSLSLGSKFKFWVEVLVWGRSLSFGSKSKFSASFECNGQ